MILDFSTGCSCNYFFTYGGLCYTKWRWIFGPKKTVLDINDHVITDIIFKSQAYIPEHSGIDWGYGVIIIDQTSGTNVIATTSHPNIPTADSELQNGNPENDVIHNHYVILGVDEQGLCGENPFIKDLTFKSPGKIFVKQNEAILKNLPKSVTGGNFDPNLVITPGTNYQVAASFQLEYVEEPMNPMNFAICVVDVRSLDPQEHSTVIIGEKDFFDDKQRPHHDYKQKPHDRHGGYDLYVDNKHDRNGYPKDNSYGSGYDYPKDNNYGGDYYQAGSYDRYNWPKNGVN